MTLSIFGNWYCLYKLMQARAYCTYLVLVYNFIWKFRYYTHCAYVYTVIVHVNSILCSKYTCGVPGTQILCLMHWFGIQPAININRLAIPGMQGPCRPELASSIPEQKKQSAVSTM